MSLKSKIYYKAKKFILDFELNQFFKEKKIQPNKYFPEELIQRYKSISSYNMKSDVLVDVGANKGFFTTVMNCEKKFKRNICIEPYKELHNEILKNNKGNFIELYDFALGEKEEKKIFYIHQEHKMSS